MWVGISAVGVFHTADGGTTWEAQNRGVRAVGGPDEYPETGQCVHKVGLHPDRPQVLYQQNHSGAYRSDDGGSSWVDRTAGLPNIPINSVTVDPADFKRVWVAADVGVYQSLDLGAHWAAFASGLPNAMAVDLLFHRQDRRLICGTRNRGAWVVQVA